MATPTKECSTNFANVQKLKNDTSYSTIIPKISYLCVMTSQEISQKILQNLGISSLNEMQLATLEAIKTQNSVLLTAPTGSGKTLAFLLPILELLETDKKNIQCLIVTPSRELAIQIEQVWRKMGTGFKVNTCYGGHSMQTEIQNLTEPPAILIGTPGRIADHLSRHSIDIQDTPILVLDEFDKSLSMGFEEEMTYIAEKLTGVKKKILVSATTLNRIPPFVGISKPTKVDFSYANEQGNDTLTLRTVIAGEENKFDKLLKLLCFLGSDATLIFCNQRETTEQVCQALQEKGIAATFFHGKMEQLDREKTLVNFRNGSVTFLVASDLAARGLDIPAVKNIVHYEMPFNLEDFTHRNGRTARMNAEGTAYLLLQSETTKIPYLDKLPPEVKIPKNVTLPKTPIWATLYVGGGKKDKLSKMDIVGFLSKKGNLEKDDIGLIEVMDFMAFVAVKKDKIATLLKLIQTEKMKGKKYKIEVAK